MLEILEFLNPGRGLIETKCSPHARTLRTDFKGKLKDAFFVLFGNRQDIFSRLLGCSKISAPAHVGVVDAVMLFIPAMLDRLTTKAMHDNNWFAFGFLLIFDLPLVLIRILIAAILAFNPLSLFVIAIVHLVSEYGAGGAKLKANFISGLLEVINQKFPNLNTEKNKQIEEKRSTEIAIETLKKGLETSPQSTIDRLDIELIPHGQTNEMEIKISERVFLGLGGGDAPALIFSYQTPISQSNQKIRMFEKALVELNYGNGVSKLEQLIQESENNSLATEFLESSSHKQNTM